jgi:hypothetical protein
VYRGLTYYHLDRRTEALRDLRDGRVGWEKTKAALSPKIAAEMQAALVDLEAKH